MVSLDHSPHVVGSGSDATVVVDLIGDLDATLASVVAEALDDLATRDDCNVRVRTSHVRNASRAGVAALSTALDAGRASGLAIVIEAGNRTVKAAFAKARLVCVPFAAITPRDRHLMLARHTPT